MRAILNLSMPLAEKKKIEKRAKMAKKTVSAYVLDSLKFQETWIQEDELVEIVKQAEKDHKEGKTKRLRSLEDLM